MDPSQRRVLVADIGGTSTRIALHDGSLGEVTQLNTAGLDLAEVLDDQARRCGAERLCVSIAGPVRDGRATLTNTGATLTASALSVPTLLVNDLHATAAGVVVLREGGGPDLGGGAIPIGGGSPETDGPLVIMGIGTGLGEAFVVGGLVVPGEGGHKSFAPSDAVQDSLLRFLRDRLARTSAGGFPAAEVPLQIDVEWVVSGLGLALLLEFAELRHPLTPAVRDALEVQPAASVVTEHAGSDPACALALDLFLRCAGAEAQALAIQVLATGGVYLCGGIPPRIASVFGDGRFRESFERSARMSLISKAIPTYLVTVPNPALIGAAALARALDA